MNALDKPLISVIMPAYNCAQYIQGAIDYNLDSCWYNPNYAPYPLSQACTYEIHSFDELKVILFEK